MRELKCLELDWHISRLKNRRYYSFVRWGDGELKALIRTEGIAGGHGKYPCSQELNRKMNASLLKYYEEENLIFGCAMRIWQQMNKHGEEWMKKHELWKVDWVNCTVFSTASKAGTLFPLIEELRKHRIIVIGPSRLKQLPKQVFKFIDFIEIHEKTGWNNPSVFKRVLKCKKTYGDGILYSFSAGIGSNIFIPNLHRKMQGNFLIDFGSVWDIFCGEESRGYMTPSRYPESKIRKNLGLL